MQLILNAFRLNVDARTVRCQTRANVIPADVKGLREQCKDTWFLHYRDGTVYGIPLAVSPSTFGEELELQPKSHAALSLLSARFNDLAPSVLPAYTALRKRPFTFEGQRQELVQIAAAKARCGHALLQHFTIRPKFEIDCRLLEAVQSDLCLVVTLAVGTKWTIDATLESLMQAGVTVQGLFAIRSTPALGERRLLGRVESVRNGSVRFSESLEETGPISSADVRLEGSLANFAHCLRILLGPSYQAFDDRRRTAEATVMGGTAQRDAIDRLGAALQKRPPIELGPGVRCSLGMRVEFQPNGRQPSAWASSPVEYCFDAAKSKRNRYAWPGLVEFGPFDRDTFARRSPRFLVVTPDTAQGTTEQFVKSLLEGVQGVMPSKYAQGFTRLFGLTSPAVDILPVPVSKDSGLVHSVYRTALEAHLARRTDYEVAVVVIDDHFSDVPNARNPYLHAKAVLMMAGVPVQEVRRSTMTRPANGLQYVLQNFAIALYAKMGGTPWTVAHDRTVTDELVIGLGSCELSGSRFHQRQRFVGITTVFRGDGNYLLSNVAKACPYEQYAEALQASTRSVLSDVKVRNGWQAGDRIRVVVHSFKPLKNVEVAQIMANSVKDVAADQTVEFAFLNIVESHPFKLLDLAQRGKPTYGGTNKGELVPERGINVQLGRSTRLLCMNGPTLIKRDVSPLPGPLLLHLHPLSTYVDQTYLTEQALKFSSLSWRSTLPAYQPVTIFYSELIAGLLARLQEVQDWSPAVLNTKLRASRWFL